MPELDKTELADKTRPDFTVNDSVTATGNATAPASETITNVTATVSPSEPNLVITPGTNTVTITGTIIDPFTDTFTYVEPGLTNLNSTPTEVVSTANMPQDKVMYGLDQDMTSFVLRTFTVVVTYDTYTSGTLNQSGLTYTEDVTLKIYNSWEGIRSFVDNYNFPSC